MSTAANFKSDATGVLDFKDPATNRKPPTITRRRDLAPSFLNLRLLSLGIKPEKQKAFLDNGGAVPAERVPRRRGRAVKKIISTPRPEPLKVRKKLLAAKCRAAGVRTPMALALAK